MDKRTILKLADYLAECFEARGVGVSKIILFGSHARGAAGEDSDVDLAVISDGFRRKGIFKRAEMVGPVHYLAVEKFMAPMDIVAMTPEELESGLSPVSGFVSQGKVVFQGRRAEVEKHKVTA